MTRRYESFDRIQFPLEFGRRLRTVRLDRRMSQATLAAVAGYHHHTISNLERGHCVPAMTAIFALAEALDIHPKDLCFGEEESDG